MATTPPPAPGTWGASETPSELHLGATAVKVLAHPLRSRIVTQLRRSGPLTATALAALLGTNSGATSYHLRRLETVGLVEDTDTGKGKERIWQAAVEQHSWTPSELVEDEDAVTALNWLERDYIRHFATKAEQWLDVQQDWPVEWVDHLGINDNVALVTLDQLRAMRSEIEEVLQKYRRVGQGNPQAKRVAVYTYAYPVDLDGSPRGDAVVNAVLSPTAARRVFLALTVTRWFPVGLVVGILTLWPLERGLTVPEALAATSLTGITVFLMELPTSGFADAFGRRPVYITAAVVLIASTVVFFTATAWWQFALAAVLTGVFRALDSGPLEAWFVDTVHVTEPGADVDRDLSRQGTVLGTAIATGALISGGLVWWHPIASQSALLLPGLLYCGLGVVHLVAVVLILKEPDRRGAADGSRLRRAAVSVREAPVVVREGLSLLGHNRVLGGLVAVELFWSAGMVVFETFQPIRLAQLLGSEDAAAAVMGPVASGGWGLFALGAALAAVGSRRLGVVRTAILARVLNGLGAVVMGLVVGPVALIAAYAVTYTLHGTAGPVHSALLHREASARNRSTVLSMNSMVSFLGFSLTAALAGQLAAHTSVQVAMVVVGAFSVLGALGYLPALRAERARPREPEPVHVG